ncbi:AfsR/SARP family transcriptional regulator [Sphaerisporangium fuscum]|uniref:AfsR/SARP family transcriptional regulator n=1 Tax=Sphaerisporangium fuscum TaxID=2835868 RepID=UPI001BDC4227|nr:AfsR/SARP family transcriptional regulator [Sphaerisporangium fuscum]
MEFGVLGPIHVVDGGVPLALRGLKQRLVLATLLRHANRPTMPAALIDALWGDAPPRTAADNVRLYVHQLRRVLGGERITRNQAGYTLHLDRGELDLHLFTSLADLGRTALAAGDHRSAAATLREALGLWRGPAYAGLEAGAELADESRRLGEIRLTTLENRIEADLALGRETDLIGELVGLVGEHPFRERLRAQLMLALSKVGRQSEALATYHEARQMFASELGLDPGPELRDLHQTILSGHLGPGPSSRRGLPAPAPPPQAAQPAQLPPDISDFTGREGHLSELISVLAHENGHDGPPVAVLAGMGGIGKTTLAVHAAHRIADRFPGGQLYANLRGVEERPADPARVLAGFLTALGVPGIGIPEALEERAALYRSHLARRTVLIILDNAASEPQVRPLLPGTSGCAVVVTSRARLSGLEGATLLDLEVMEPESARELLARTAGRARVSAEPGAAAEIVRLCACVPLAVRVAGARLAARPQWSLAWFARQLGDERRRLDHLATGDLAVRASLALSYVGLSDRTRQAFRLLGLLNAPDVAAWTAQALLDCSEEESERLVEALVDAQLLTVGGADATGRLRYRFHDLVRLYARERAEIEESAEDRMAALARAFGGWLALAEEAMPRVPGSCYAAVHGRAARWRLPSGMVSDLLKDPQAWFDAERAALRSAVFQACELVERHTGDGLAEAHDLVDLAWDLAACLEHHLDLRGLFDEWRTTHERVMRVCRDTGDLLGEAVMLRGLLDVTTWLDTGQPGGAMATMRAGAERLLAMFAEAGERKALSDAYVMRAWGLVAEGRADEALASAATALRVAEETRHLGGRARANLALAVAHGERRPDQAIRYLGKGMELAEALGNPRFESTALQFLGLAQVEAGLFASARDNLSRSLAICRQLGDQLSEATALSGLARLYVAHGDPRSRTTAEAAVDLSRRCGLSHHLADALWVLGRLDLAEGKVSRAVAGLEESVQLWRRRGWLAYLARTLTVLGEAYAANDDPSAAARAWQEASGLFTAIGDTSSASRVSALLIETA